MKTTTYRLLILTLIRVTVYSCQNKFEQPVEEPTLAESLVSKPDAGKQVVLGKKLENPYSIKNMRKAYASLMKKQKKSIKTNVSLTLNDSTAIETTHYYVKFFVKNDEQKKPVNCRFFRPFEHSFRR